MRLAPVPSCLVVSAEIPLV